MNLPATKENWRRYLIERRDGMEKTHRQAAHGTCSQFLSELISPKADMTIAVYAAMGTELDPAPFVEICWKVGARVVFPQTRFENRTCRLYFSPTTTWAALIPTRRGLREPAGIDAVVPAEIDLMVIPGLGFDLRGARLGYGAACYDHFLADPTVTAKRVGIGYQVCIVDHLPTESHDQFMDYVVTEQRVYDINRG
ncbi:MAG: 5-formyltetrahydrofolate cyclo-ligase [Myxococcales bacterium]|nr:5-formyltetrahydrofolate cyclo-ligase [Myxococcales bacterium]